MTCLEMVETRNFESAKRVRLVNEFRINADLELFTEGDEKLVQYLKAGLCRTVLLQSETELKLALERLDANLEQQKQDAAKVLMDAAFKKYETEIAACTPPAEKVDIFGRRVGDTMTLGLGWNRNYKSCLLGYRASYKLGREKALAQRTLYYLVELEKIENSFAFFGRVPILARSRPLLQRLLSHWFRLSLYDGLRWVRYFNAGSNQNARKETKEKRY